MELGLHRRNRRLRRLLGGPVCHPWLGLAMKLSAAEIDILERLARGGSTLTVARERGTGHETVRKQVKMLREKIGARNHAHAVAIAMRNGLLS
jgi:DNA-binding CsgD family transcriptional regulator